MKAIVRVTRNYQVTLPLEVRDQLSIRVGDKLEVTVEGDKIIMRKLNTELPEVSLGYSLSPEEEEKLINESVNVD